MVVVNTTIIRSRPQWPPCVNDRQEMEKALHQVPDQCGWMELIIDRRKTIADLKTAIKEVHTY
jgi:hypothetical protein